MDGPWTILELAELAADALAPGSDAGGSDAGRPGAGRPGAGRPGAGRPEAGRAEAVRPGAVRANGRVRDVPNERLVRWYVTVGLVDPPLSRRGRVAQYGRRHLLQLVAVKRRQAEGRSLAEIQTELAGATDETLAAVARVPAGLAAAEPHAPEPAAAEPAAAELPGLEPAGPAPGRFWTRSASGRDAGTAAGPEEEEEPGTAGPRGRAAGAVAGSEEAGRGRSGIVHGIRLAPGVTLLLEDGGREPGPDDVIAIVNAARPLLAELASRHHLNAEGSQT
jgi:DNA-binding transcriptional MerR regulator